MKNPHFLRTSVGIEILESRIAPAAVTLHFFDQDNHPVTVTSSKGTMGELQTAVGVAEGGVATSVLSFQFGAPFKGADITLTAGANATDAITTRVGFVNAAGFDLGKLTIDGELDRINAGDGNSATAALKALSVASWGDGTLPATAGQFDSMVIGAITSLTVKGDFNGAFLTVVGSASDTTHDPYTPSKTDLDGKIGTLSIGGSLRGTARESGGHIFTTGDIGKATVVGSVIGFADPMPPKAAPTDQDFNGRIFSRGVIASLVIGTDAVPGHLGGGDGASSGQIVGVSGIGSVTVKGNVQGGIGKDSGSIGAVGNIGMAQVTGDLTGGRGLRSGTLLGYTTINNVKIGGDIQGGSGENSGAIGAGSKFSSVPGLVQIGNVVVAGDIIGGDGPSSGQIVSQGTIKNVTVRNLIGGSNFETGAIGSLKGLGAILVKGDIVAGTGTRSGFITTEEKPILRGDGPPVDPSAANAPIASVTVLGSILGNPGAGAIVGGWTLTGADQTNDPLAFTFLSDGTYFEAEGFHNDPIGTHQPGMERGTYTWDPSTGAFTVKTIEDTNGDWGLSDGQTQSRTVTISGDTLTGTGPEGTHEFSRVTSPTNPLVGSWSGGGGIAAFTFLSDGTYFEAEAFHDDPIGSHQPGMERGTYTWDPLTGAFSHTTLEDTNGDWGLSDSDINFVTVNGDVITALSGASSDKFVGSRAGPVPAPPGLTGPAGYRAGGILSSGKLGPVVVLGDVIGGDNFETGRIASSHAITSVKIGGSLVGGLGGDSGSVFAQTTLGPVSIGDASYHGDSAGGFSGRGIIGGSGARSGAVIAGTLAKIDVYGNMEGDFGPESAVVKTIGSGAAGKMGAVYIRGNVVGGAGSASIRSGSIISSGALASVLIGTDTADAAGSSALVGGDAAESGNIISALDMGVVYVEGNIMGGVGDASGRISSGADLASVYVGDDLRGGTGDGSGTIRSVGALGPVLIGVGGTAADIHKRRSDIPRHLLTEFPGTAGGDLVGGAGDRSGAVISGGKLAKIDVFGSVLGGDGPGSGRIETQGDMGAVFIAKSLIGSFGSSSAVDAGQIFSAGKLASVVIGDPKDSDTESGSMIGGLALRSGTITSEMDMGAVKIKRDLQGGTGDDSGKITSGGKLTSLTVGSATLGGSIRGGTGNYDTTVESGNHFGQVFAAGAIGPVVVFGNVQGNTSNSEGGAYSAQIRGLSIASVTVHGNLSGGLGDHSGGFFATSLNIGPIDIAGNLQGGGGFASGFISAEGNLASVKIGASLYGGSGSGSGYVAARGNLGSFEADFASGDSDSSRPRISAGRMISSVTINESIFNTDILAGYGTSGLEFNPDAQIGTVKIGTGTGPGNLQGTNIVAGMSRGMDGFFGTYDDHLIMGSGSPTIFSKIASVIVKGTISNTTDSSLDTFGIVAEHLVSLKIGSSTLPLHAGPLSPQDFYKPVGPSSDTAYGELPID